MALERYEADLTRVLVDLIQREGYVKSGRLRDSIDVKITDDLNVEVNSQDYIKYLESGGRPILEKYLNSTEVLDIIERALVEYIQDKINQQQ